MPRKLAIVTGANRGIGLSIVRQLCKEFNGDVMLTARSTENGLNAVKLLNQEGLHPVFCELDISQPGSIRMLEDVVKTNYGGRIDILINNAAVSFNKEDRLTLSRKAELCFEVDFRGTLNVCRILMPYVCPQGRVIIVTNGYVGLRKNLQPKAQKLLAFENMTYHELSNLMESYVKAVKTDLHTSWGWPQNPSETAKVFLVAMAKILAREMRNDNRANILLNACCPGWTNSGASKDYIDSSGCCNGIKAQSADESAKDIVWLATLPPGTTSPNGELVRHRKVIDY